MEAPALPIQEKQQNSDDDNDKSSGTKNKNDNRNVVETSEQKQRQQQEKYLFGALSPLRRRNSEDDDVLSSSSSSSCCSSNNNDISDNNDEQSSASAAATSSSSPLNDVNRNIFPEKNRVTSKKKFLRRNFKRGSPKFIKLVFDQKKDFLIQKEKEKRKEQEEQEQQEEDNILILDQGGEQQQIEGNENNNEGQTENPNNDNNNNDNVQQQQQNEENPSDEEDEDNPSPIPHISHIAFSPSDDSKYLACSFATKNRLVVIFETKHFTEIKRIQCRPQRNQGEDIDVGVPVTFSLQFEKKETRYIFPEINLLGDDDDNDDEADNDEDVKEIEVLVQQQFLATGGVYDEICLYDCTFGEEHEHQHQHEHENDHENKKKKKKNKNSNFHPPFDKSEPPLAGHTGQVLAIAFNPVKNDEVTSLSQDCTIRVWSLSSRTESNVLQHNGRPHMIVYSTNGESLFLGDKNGSVLEVAAGGNSPRLKREFQSSGSDIVGLCLSKSSQYLFAASSDRVIRCWDLSEQGINNNNNNNNVSKRTKQETETPKFFIRTKSKITGGISLSNTDSVIVAGCIDGNVRYYSASSGHLISINNIGGDGEEIEKEKDENENENNNNITKRKKKKKNKKKNHLEVTDAITSVCFDKIPILKSGQEEHSVFVNNLNSKEEVKTQKEEKDEKEKDESHKNKNNNNNNNKTNELTLHNNNKDTSNFILVGTSTGKLQISRSVIPEMKFQMRKVSLLIRMRSKNENIRNVFASALITRNVADFLPFILFGLA